MAKIKIDKKFQSIVQPLSDIEYTLLEQDILARGCLDPLKVWKGHNILLDGYHRYKICQENNLDFKVEEVNFPDRETAEAWIIQNQLARRNLNAFQRCEIAMKAEPFLRKEAKKQQGKRTDILLLKIKGLDTQKRLAGMAGVSKTTMYQVKVIVDTLNEDKESPIAKDTRKKLIDGKWRIGTVYRKIMAFEHYFERFEKEREAEEAKKKFSKELLEGETPYVEDIENVINSLNEARMSIIGINNSLSWRLKIGTDEFINSYKLDGEREIVYYLFPDLMREFGLLGREYKRLRKLKIIGKKVSAEGKKTWLSEKYRKSRKSYGPGSRRKLNKSSVGYAIEQLFRESFQKKST